MITFYEFGDDKDLADVKYHFEDTVVVVTLYYRTGLQLLELVTTVPDLINFYLFIFPKFKCLDINKIIF